MLAEFYESQYSMTPKAFITTESFKDCTKYFIEYLKKNQ